MKFFPCGIREDGAFYLFDPQEFKKRVSFLQKAFPGIPLCFAVKANPFLAGTAAEVLPRLEVCSPGEEAVCRAAGVPAAGTVISGVYKDPHFLEKLVAEGHDRIYTVESENQFLLLMALAEQYRQPIKLLFRLSNGSQFGMDEETAEKLIVRAARLPLLTFRGLQYFSGTQKTSLKKAERELAALVSFAERLEARYGFSVEEIEYGPGLPVSYFEEDTWNEAEFLAGFATLLAPVTAKYTVILELGRALAATAGRYYTHVADVKQTAGQNYLITDGGMHQIAYDGQMLAMKKPFLTLPGREKEARTTRYTVCGALCSMHDILVKDIPLPAMEAGDLICFENAGAYCATEGMALFLCRDLPAVYLADGNGGAVCARPRTETAPLCSSFPL